jgi:hypothetical protein
MARQDNRGYRPWIKLRLKDAQESLHVIEIIEYWQRSKEAALHVTRAIQMYYALTGGDTTLLRKYFPGILAGMSNGTPPPMAKPTTPAKVEAVTRSEDEDKADLLDGLF